MEINGDRPNENKKVSLLGASSSKGIKDSKDSSRVGKSYGWKKEEAFRYSLLAQRRCRQAKWKEGALGHWPRGHVWLFAIGPRLELEQKLSTSSVINQVLTIWTKCNRSSCLAS